MENLSLTPGETYYGTVSVCNAAGLCGTETSDGIMPDLSPPHIGTVRHGLGSARSGYQSSRYCRKKIHVTIGIIGNDQAYHFHWNVPTA